MYKKFKFHYDSINSMVLIDSDRLMERFKFHYDSINSTAIHREMQAIFNLNSIMILLIPDARTEADKKTTAFKFHYDSINSKGFRLGPVKHIKFKFHYDSINSRPKIIPLFKPKNVSILSTSSKFNISFLSLIIYFCNTSYFRRFRLLSIPYIFCTIMGRQKPLIFQVDFVRHILL